MICKWLWGTALNAGEESHALYHVTGLGQDQQRQDALLPSSNSQGREILRFITPLCT